MAEQAVLVVLSTFPNLEKARQIGTLMVEMQLAACVTLVPGVESIYRWEDQVCRETEVQALFKVTQAGEPALTKALLKAHPYDVPEILALPVQRGNDAYLRWVAEFGEGCQG